MVHDEPCMDVTHLGHVELLTPKPEESLRFFVDAMGMTESGRQGDSVFLRGMDQVDRVLTSRGQRFRRHHAAACADRGENHDPTGTTHHQREISTKGLTLCNRARW